MRGRTLSLNFLFYQLLNTNIYNVFHTKKLQCYFIQSELRLAKPSQK